AGGGPIEIEEAATVIRLAAICQVAEGNEQSRERLVLGKRDQPVRHTTEREVQPADAPVFVALSGGRRLQLDDDRRIRGLQLQLGRYVVGRIDRGGGQGGKCGGPGL